MQKIPKILLVAAVLLALSVAAVIAHGPDEDGDWRTEMKEYHEKIHGDSFDEHHASVHGEDWEDHVEDCHATSEDGDRTAYDHMGGMMGTI